VGVLATPATFQGALYASVVERFAQDVILYQHTCPGLVTQIEQGDLDGPKTREILTQALQPMLAQGIDTVVLGCTHYPFVIPLIQAIAGPQVRVIDPAPAIARQVGRLLQIQNKADAAHRSGTTGYFTTGDPSRLQDLLPRLLGEPGVAKALTWNNWELY
jgi:glutamate racemase